MLDPSVPSLHRFTENGEEDGHLDCGGEVEEVEEEVERWKVRMKRWRKRMERWKESSERWKRGHVCGASFVSDPPPVQEFPEPSPPPKRVLPRSEFRHGANFASLQIGEV